MTKLARPKWQIASKTPQHDPRLPMAKVYPKIEGRPLQEQIRIIVESALKRNVTGAVVQSYQAHTFVRELTAQGVGVISTDYDIPERGLAVIRCVGKLLPRRSEGNDD